MTPTEKELESQLRTQLKISAVAKKLFEILDSEILGLYNLYMQNQMSYPSAKSLESLAEGEKAGLGKSKTLAFIDTQKDAWFGHDRPGKR